MNLRVHWSVMRATAVSVMSGEAENKKDLTMMFRDQQKNSYFQQFDRFHKKSQDI